MYFKIKENRGSHAQADLKTKKTIIYKSSEGKVIESEIDLCAKFPDKFEKVEMGFARSAPVEEIVEETIEETIEEIVVEVKPEPKKPKSKSAGFGTDVSDKFPLIKEIEEEEDVSLKVFYKKGKGFFITTAEDLGTALNENKLKKANVEDFIESLFAEEEDE